MNAGLNFLGYLYFVEGITTRYGFNEDDWCGFTPYTENINNEEYYS